MYRPFIDDPTHAALLDGQRYVVLRVTGTVRDTYAQLQRTVREKLAGLKISYPAQPHVTLAGLGRGTTVDEVRELVTDWARSMSPLSLEIEKVSCFPTPSQIVIVQIRKTSDLARAMSSLRERARQYGLVDLAAIAPADWIFHLSVAYCSSLSPASWANVKHWVATLAVPTAREIVSEAEIAAFDSGQESSGGKVTLSASGPGAE